MLSIASQIELRTAQNQLMELSQRPSLNASEKRQFDALLSKISLLKSGAISDEVRAAQADQLAKEFGFAPIDRSERAKINLEWRAFALKGEVRTYSGLVSEGSSFVPQGFHQTIFSAMAQFDDIWSPEVVTFIDTETGNHLPIPELTDVAQTSSQIGEGSESSETELGTAGQEVLKAYSQRSGMVFLTTEALQDFGVNTQALLENAFALRFARGCGQLAISGSGTNQPKGIVTSAPVGATAENATFLTLADLRATYFSVNPYWRKNGRWLLNDTTLQMIASLVDGNNRPLINLQAPVLSLMGCPVSICPSMSDPAASAVVALFGNTKQFVIRRASGYTRVQGFTQIPNAAEYGIVGFQSYLRFDSRLMIADSDFPPVKALQMAS